MTSGLFTDRYELTMLSAFVADGSADHPSVFELFARGLPPGRRFGILAGLGRFLDALTEFTFDDHDLAWLRDVGALTPEAASWLADFRFSGDIDAYAEGDLYWPGSPVLTVSGRLGECILLETLALSIINFDTAIASAAARMVLAAGDRTLIEMGSRRAHEEAAVAAARAAYAVGFIGTSNLAAGRRFGLPTLGTAAHAFTLAHRTEAEAFAAQIAAQGVGTTLLVDTYDTEQGIRTAVQVAGPQLGAIRIDSGDLAVESRRARALLDSQGATSTQIIVTSDLDEYAMTRLAEAPIDGYGVGTRVVTGSGHPTAGMVYKLVAVGDAPGGPLRPVAKDSPGKESVGGRKTAFRMPDGREFYTLRQDVPAGGVPVARRVVEHGVIAPLASLAQVREQAATSLAWLPSRARSVADGPPWQECTQSERG
ncbi:MAG: nicotinate phosphoribosyltransferase [Nostocoides sp.]